MNDSLLRSSVCLLLALSLAGAAGCSGEVDDNRVHRDGGGGDPERDSGPPPDFLSNIDWEDNYPEGFKLTEVPDPTSSDNPLFQVSMDIPEPQVGEVITDENFGTFLRRATGWSGVRNEYSRFDPYNNDHTKVILYVTEDGAKSVFDATQFPVEDHRVCPVPHGHIEPRWDPEDSDVFWSLDGFAIYRTKASTCTTEMVKDFANDPEIKPILDANDDIYQITTKEEGEASMDMRYWALFLQGTSDDYRPRHIFVWDRQEDQILGQRSLPEGERRIDWVSMSPLGNYVLIGGMSYNEGELQGLTMADRELTRFHRLDYSTAHADLGVSQDGREVVVMQNVRTDHVDMIPVEWETQPILEVGVNQSYAGTNRTKLVRLTYENTSPYLMITTGLHITCNFPGYCVVSTCARESNVQNWLDRKNVLVQLNHDKARAFYLAGVHNTTDGYRTETQATMSRDGRKIGWASNWNSHVGETEYFYVELLMPNKWWETL